MKGTKPFIPIMAMIEAIPENEKLDDGQVRKIEEAIRLALLEWRQSKPVPYALAALSIGGLLYILVQLLQPVFL